MCVSKLGACPNRTFGDVALREVSVRSCMGGTYVIRVFGLQHNLPFWALRDLSMHFLVVARGGGGGPVVSGGEVLKHS